MNFREYSTTVDTWIRLRCLCSNILQMVSKICIELNTYVPSLRFSMLRGQKN